MVVLAQVKAWWRRGFNLENLLSQLAGSKCTFQLHSGIGHDGPWEWRSRPKVEMVEGPLPPSTDLVCALLSNSAMRRLYTWLNQTFKWKLCIPYTIGCPKKMGKRLWPPSNSSKLQKLGVFWKIPDICYNMDTEIFKIKKRIDWENEASSCQPPSKNRVLGFDTSGQGCKTTFILPSTNIWNKFCFHCKSSKDIKGVHIVTSEFCPLRLHFLSNFLLNIEFCQISWILTTPAFGFRMNL